MSSSPRKARLLEKVRLSLQGRNLFFNYASMLSGTISAKALALVSVLMLTRYLGPEKFGLYSLVFSYWSLMNLLVDLGQTQILARELARSPENSRACIESAVYVRLLGCIIFLLPGFFLAQFLGLAGDLTLAALLGILVAFESIYDVIFTARMHLHDSARARLFSSAGNVLLMAMAIWLKWPLIAVVLIALLNPLLKLVFDIRFAGVFSLKLHKPDTALIGRFLKDGWPLWLLGLQYMVSSRIDTFMLQVLAPNGEYELGIYSAAFRFSEVLSLLITAMGPALMPLLVRHTAHPERIRFLAGTGIRTLLLLLMTISLLIFWYAPWITQLYGSAYQPATPCMRILIWSQAMVAVHALCYQLLVVYNVQGRQAVILGGLIMTFINILLNFWLIPVLGALGASWATVFTELGLMILMIQLVQHYTPLRLGRSILGFQALALVSWAPGLLLGEVHGWSSAVLFAGLIFAFRLLSLPDIRALAHEKLHADPPNPS